MTAIFEKIHFFYSLTNAMLVVFISFRNNASIKTVLYG